jgi:hypothetical protein
MRLVYENRDEARRVGLRAKSDVIEQLHPATVGALVRERLETIARAAPIATGTARLRDEPPVRRRAPAIKYWLGMTTMDRSKLDPPRRNYLHDTLASFAASGPARAGVSYELHLFDTGSSDPTWLDGVAGEHHFPAKRLRANQNVVALLRAGAEADCEWVIWLEDDLAFCSDFLGSIDRWLTEHAREDRRVYAFHASYQEVLEAFERGETAWDYPIDYFYGTQCIAMRPEDAASSADKIEELALAWRASAEHDLMIKNWAKERWPEIDCFLASVPSFVQHTGSESTLHLGSLQENPSFQGPDWSYRPGLSHG